MKDKMGQAISKALLIIKNNYIYYKDLLLELYIRFLSPTTYSVFSYFVFPIYTRFYTIFIKFQWKIYHYSIIIILYHSQHSQNLNFVLIGIYCFCFIKFFRFLPHRPKCHIRVGYLHFEQHKYNLLQILYIHGNNNTTIAIIRVT